MDTNARRYLIDDPATGARLACEVSWLDLADVYTRRQMDEIATMAVGETSSITFDGRIQRIA
jgi:hypothetical protein